MDLTTPIPPLPPNQQLAAPGKWPVVGEKAPRASDEPWQVSVVGLVAGPLAGRHAFSLDELLAMPRVERVVDIHCVTRWSKPAARFGGVLLETVLRSARPLPAARFVSFVARSQRNHSTSLPLTDALGLGTLIAFTCDGRPLEPMHGGPVRTVVPGRYFYKSLKWLETVELLAEDRLGFWEAEAGYHNTADPWREQRYMASGLGAREAAALLQSRDFAGRDLRGIEAEGRDLAGLDARGAALRDARFRRADLRGACFDGANLSNAHLQGADLRGATFGSHMGRNADLEGADFRGADLRGADFGEASLFGATFCPTEAGAGGPGEWGPARIDGTTRLGDKAVETLSATPVQYEFIRNATGRG